MHPRDHAEPRHRRSGSPRHRFLAVALAAGAVVLGVVVTRPLLTSGARAPDHSVMASTAHGDAAWPVRGSGSAPADPYGPVSAVSSTVAEPGRGPVARAAAMLRAWDAQRARAWAEGDAARLRALYVGRAGVADVRLLRRYADRGLRVDGLTTQLLAVEVLERAPGRWRLRVTDRVAGGVVVGAGDRLRLPHDRADTRIVVLARDVGGGWRVARVRALGRGGP